MSFYKQTGLTTSASYRPLISKTGEKLLYALRRSTCTYRRRVNLHAIVQRESFERNVEPGMRRDDEVIGGAGRDFDIRRNHECHNRDYQKIWFRPHNFVQL